MKYHSDFTFSGETFEEKIGEPDRFDAAMGRVVLGFSYLEDAVRNIICLLVSPDMSVGRIVSAGLGFRQRLDIMASLTRHRISSFPPVDGREFFDEWFGELLLVCVRAEDLRNQYVHSSYAGGMRAKTTARAKRGLQTRIERADADLILDVADYIVGIAMEVEGLPLLLGLADQLSAGSRHIRYTLAGEEVATFFFGDQPFT